MAPFSKINGTTLINILFLAVCICVGGCYSLMLGQDIASDTLSHTLYLPYAWLNGRLGLDFAAAGNIFSFQNPLLYVPYYLCFQLLNTQPYLFTFLQGIPFGLFLFFSWKICRIAFVPFDVRKNKFFYLCVFLSAISGLSTANQVGLSSGQLWLALFFVIALYILFSGPKDPKRQTAALFLSGTALGLSNTALPFCVGIWLGVWYLWHQYQLSSKMMCLNFCGFLLGFCLSFGFFLLGAHIQNADWPRVLHAALPDAWAFSPASSANLWEMPLNWREWLLLPWERIGHFSSEYRIDARILVGTVSSLLLVANFGITHSRTSWTKGNLAWVLIFTGTYITWLLCSRTNVSTPIMEFLSIILLGRLILTFFQPVSAAVLMLCAFGLLSFQNPLDTPRQGVENKNFYFIPTPDIQPNAFILTVGPVAGLLPFLPHAPLQAAGVWLDPQDYPPASRRQLDRFNDLPAAHYSHDFDERIKKALIGHNGPIYVLTRKTDLLNEPAVWQRYGITLTNEACLSFSNNNTSFSQKGFLLCPADLSQPQ